MPLVLAVEPDHGQATILRRLVKELVRAEVVCADNTEHALQALDARVPDLVLLSALLPPRDEEALTEHLRSLGGVPHLETLTIPLLAPFGTNGSNRKGFLSSFGRRSKAPVGGCDPRVFAQEVKTYLEHARAARAEAEARAHDEEIAAAFRKSGATPKEAEEDGQVPPGVQPEPERSIEAVPLDVPRAFYDRPVHQSEAEDVRCRLEEIFSLAPTENDGFNRADTEEAIPDPVSRPPLAPAPEATAQPLVEYQETQEQQAAGPADFELTAADTVERQEIEEIDVAIDLDSLEPSGDDAAEAEIASPVESSSAQPQPPVSEIPDVLLLETPVEGLQDSDVGLRTLLLTAPAEETEPALGQATDQQAAVSDLREPFPLEAPQIEAAAETTVEAPAPIGETLLEEPQEEQPVADSVPEPPLAPAPEATAQPLVEYQETQEQQAAGPADFELTAANTVERQEIEEIDVAIDLDSLEPSGDDAAEAEIASPVESSSAQPQPPVSEIPDVLLLETPVEGLQDSDVGLRTLLLTAPAEETEPALGQATDQQAAVSDLREPFPLEAPQIEAAAETTVEAPAPIGETLLEEPQGEQPVADSIREWHVEQPEAEVDTGFAWLVENPGAAKAVLSGPAPAPTVQVQQPALPGQVGFDPLTQPPEVNEPRPRGWKHRLLGTVSTLASQVKESVGRPQRQFVTLSIERAAGHSPASRDGDAPAVARTEPSIETLTTPARTDGGSAAEESFRTDARPVAEAVEPAVPQAERPQIVPAAESNIDADAIPDASTDAEAPVAADADDAVAAGANLVTVRQEQDVSPPEGEPLPDDGRTPAGDVGEEVANTSAQPQGELHGQAGHARPGPPPCFQAHGLGAAAPAAMAASRSGNGRELSFKEAPLATARGNETEIDEDVETECVVVDSGLDQPGSEPEADEDEVQWLKTTIATLMREIQQARASRRDEEANAGPASRAAPSASGSQLPPAPPSQALAAATPRAPRPRAAVAGWVRPRRPAGPRLAPLALWARTEPEPEPAAQPRRMRRPALDGMFEQLRINPAVARIGRPERCSIAAVRAAPVDGKEAAPAGAKPVVILPKTIRRKGAAPRVAAVARKAAKGDTFVFGG